MDDGLSCSSVGKKNKKLETILCTFTDDTLMMMMIGTHRGMLHRVFGVCVLCKENYGHLDSLKMAPPPNRLSCFWQLPMLESARVEFSSDRKTAKAKTKEPNRRLVVRSGL